MERVASNMIREGSGCIKNAYNFIYFWHDFGLKFAWES